MNFLRLSKAQIKNLTTNSKFDVKEKKNSRNFIKENIRQLKKLNVTKKQRTNQSSSNENEIYSRNSKRIQSTERNQQSFRKHKQINNNENNNNNKSLLMRSVKTNFTKNRSIKTNRKNTERILETEEQSEIDLCIDNSTQTIDIDDISFYDDARILQPSEKVQEILIKERLKKYEQIENQNDEKPDELALRGHIPKLKEFLDNGYVKRMQNDDLRKKLYENGIVFEGEKLSVLANTNRSRQQSSRENEKSSLSVHDNFSLSSRDDNLSKLKRNKPENNDRKPKRTVNNLYHSNDNSHYLIDSDNGSGDCAKKTDNCSKPLIVLYERSKKI